MSLNNLISSESPHHHHRRLLTLPLVVLALLLIQLNSLSSSRTPIGAEASPTQSMLTSALVGAGASGGGGGIAGGGGGGGAGSVQESKVFKRSFAGLGCLGVYDKAKFARLDRVCEECYTLYREPDIHSACR